MISKTEENSIAPLLWPGEPLAGHLRKRLASAPESSSQRLAHFSKLEQKKLELEGAQQHNRVKDQRVPCTGTLGSFLASRALVSSLRHRSVGLLLHRNQKPDSAEV